MLIDDDSKFCMGCGSKIDAALMAVPQNAEKKQRPKETVKDIPAADNTAMTENAGVPVAGVEKPKTKKGVVIAFASVAAVAFIAVGALIFVLISKNNGGIAVSDTPSVPASSADTASTTADYGYDIYAPDETSTPVPVETTAPAAEEMTIEEMEKQMNSIVKDHR